MKTSGKRRSASAAAAVGLTKQYELKPYWRIACVYARCCTTLGREIQIPQSGVLSVLSACRLSRADKRRTKFLIIIFPTE